MSNTNANFEMTGILLGQEARKRKNSSGEDRHYPADDGAGHECLPCRPPAWYPAQPAVFKWKKQYQEGSLTAVAAGEEVVPASELTAALKQVRNFSAFWARRRWKLRS